MHKLLLFFKLSLLAVISSGLIACGDDSYLMVFKVENHYSEELQEVNIYIFDSVKAIPSAILTTPLPTLRSQLASNSEQNRKVQNVAVNSTSPEMSFTIPFENTEKTKTYFILVETLTGKVMSNIFSSGAEGYGGITGRDLNDIYRKITIDKDGQIIDGF